MAKEHKNSFKGEEKREFERFPFAVALNYKVCKKNTILQLFDGYSVDISTSGLQCNIKEKVIKGDILWLSFDRSTLILCTELEKRALIYQSGIVGKVAWIDRKEDGTFDTGIQFFTREEKNLTQIYPDFYFLENSLENKNGRY